MDSEKVIQDLNQRFAKPLPEFYKRRIISDCGGMRRNKSAGRISNRHCAGSG